MTVTVCVGSVVFEVWDMQPSQLDSRLALRGCKDVPPWQVTGFSPESAAPKFAVKLTDLEPMGSLADLHPEFARVEREETQRVRQLLGRAVENSVPLADGAHLVTIELSGHRFGMTYQSRQAIRDAIARGIDPGRIFTVDRECPDRVRSWAGYVHDQACERLIARHNDERGF